MFLREQKFNLPPCCIWSVVSCVSREVDLGPFKHKIDDGLELRKAAFECMDVLLERCRDCIDMPAFITHLEKGLQVGFSSCQPSKVKLLATKSSAQIGCVYYQPSTQDVVMQALENYSA